MTCEKKLEEKIEQLKSIIRRQTEMLKELEWIVDESRRIFVYRCPNCGNKKSQEHYDSCILNIAIKAGEDVLK